MDRAGSTLGDTRTDRYDITVCHVVIVHSRHSHGTNNNCMLRVEVLHFASKHESTMDNTVRTLRARSKMAAPWAVVKPSIPMSMLARCTVRALWIGAAAHTAQVCISLWLATMSVAYCTQWDIAIENHERKVLTQSERPKLKYMPQHTPASHPRTNLVWNCTCHAHGLPSHPRRHTWHRSRWCGQLRRVRPTHPRATRGQ